MGMKKKVMAAGLAACMGATLIGGATLAYFTDKDERTNSFTVAGADGQPALDIVMTETSVEGNGMVAGVATDDGYKYENIVPGVTYSKNVDVDLGEKSIDSHLYVELTITNYENLCLATKGIETPGSGPVENIGKYIVNPHANLNASKLIATKRVESDTPAEDTLSLVFDMGVMDKDTAHVDVFDAVKVPGELGNEEMKNLKDGVDLSVKAYAIQKAGRETDEAAEAAAMAEWFTEANGYEPA